MTLGVAFLRGGMTKVHAPGENIDQKTPGENIGRKKFCRRVFKSTTFFIDTMATLIIFGTVTCLTILPTRSLGLNASLGLSIVVGVGAGSLIPLFDYAAYKIAPHLGKKSIKATVVNDNL